MMAMQYGNKLLVTITTCFFVSVVSSMSKWTSVDMDSPPSPAVANFFIEEFEEEHSTGLTTSIYVGSGMSKQYVCILAPWTRKVRQLS
jgi:hypothetical protein